MIVSIITDIRFVPGAAGLPGAWASFVNAETGNPGHNAVCASRARDRERILGPFGTTLTGRQIMAGIAAISRRRRRRLIRQMLAEAALALLATVLLVAAIAMLVTP